MMGITLSAILQTVSKDLGLYGLEVLSMPPEEQLRLLNSYNQIFKRTQEIFALPETRRQAAYDAAVKQLMIAANGDLRVASAFEGKSWEAGTRDAIEHIVSVAELISLQGANAGSQSRLS